MNIEICEGVVENLTVRNSRAGKSSISVASFDLGNSEIKFQIRGLPDNYDKFKEKYLINGDPICIAFSDKNFPVSLVYYFYNKRTKMLKGANWNFFWFVIGGFFLIYAFFLVKMNEAGVSFIDFMKFSIILLSVLSPLFILIIWIIRPRYIALKLIKDHLRK